MKKKAHPFFPFVCIIFVLCVAIYYVGSYKKEPKQAELQSNGSTDTDTSNQDTSNQDTSSQDNSVQDTSSQDTSSQDTQNTDILPSETPTEDISQGSESPSSDPEELPVTSTTLMSRESLRELSASTIISINEVGDNFMENCFYYEEIKDDVKLRIVGKSYGDNCTVPYEDLKYVRVLYYGFDEAIHIGELIVNTAIAEDIVAIFAELYTAQYPIEQMILVDEYNADDNTSMAANNTSSFNYRLVPGSTHLSKHALGLAIDINPLYNPYVKYNENETIILPEEGIPYVDRTLDCPYYIDENDLCYQAFTKRGFTWGGFWKNDPDYQHFQKSID